MNDLPPSVVTRIIPLSSAPACALEAMFAAEQRHEIVAQNLEVNRTTLYNWRKQGRIPTEGAKNYVLELERLYGIPRWLSRPDIYEWPTGAAALTRTCVFILKSEE